MTTSKKHAELKRLAKATQQNIYDMLRLTDEILQDREYVDANDGEAKLLEAMEATEFSHFGGKPSLDSMLRAYRMNPKRATWVEYKYNLQVMIDLATPDRESGDTVRVNWKAMAAELQEKLDAVTALLGEYKATTTELRSRNEELIGQVGELRGQVKLLSSRGLAMEKKWYPFRYGV